MNILIRRDILFEVIAYITDSGNSPIEEYIEKLARLHKTQEIAQIKLYIDRLAEYGLKLNEKFPKSYKKLDDKIFELRPGNNRVLFFYFIGNQFVLLHGFRKSSQKTPKCELKKANRERNDFIRRQKS